MPISLKGNFQDPIREEQRDRDRIPAVQGSLKEQMSLEQYQRLQETQVERLLFNEQLFRDQNG